MTVVVLDHRERALSDALQIEHLMSDLPVGDILLRFDGGAEWIVERKTVRDLASSIRRRLSSSLRLSRTCQKCRDWRVWLYNDRLRFGPLGRAIIPTALRWLCKSLHRYRRRSPRGRARAPIFSIARRLSECISPPRLYSTSYIGIGRNCGVHHEDDGEGG